MIRAEKLTAGLKIETRPYQVRIVNKALDYLIDKKYRSVLIEAPCGSGKTCMALMLCKVLYDLKKYRIGWVAMRRNLLTQARNENIEKGFNLPMKFISMFDKNPPTDLDVLVVDEAQHDVTKSMLHLHALVKPKYVIGATMTPYRLDRVKLCFDAVVKDAGIATLIRDGYLSPYHHYTIPKWTPKDVAELYLSDIARWGKSLMFFHRINQCEEARSILLRGGVACDVISGKTDVDEQLTAFSKNEFTVAINCMKLTEGFDHPALKTVFGRPSAKSVTIQMCGRALRKHALLPYKQIVQVEGTPYVFTKTALPILQYSIVNGDWRTLQVNPHIEEITKRTITALAQLPDMRLPDYIIKAKGKPSLEPGGSDAADFTPGAHDRTRYPEDSHYQSRDANAEGF